MRIRIHSPGIFLYLFSLQFKSGEGEREFVLPAPTRMHFISARPVS